MKVDLNDVDSEIRSKESHRFTVIQPSCIRGTLLENYSFDARDFTESQLNTLNHASMLRFGNKDLKSRLLSAIRSQRLLKEKYFKRVGQARSEAFAKYLRHKNASQLNLPSSVLSMYETALENLKKLLQSLIPSKVSIYTKDYMQWPEIIVSEKEIQKPHLIAAMPPDCIDLDGWDRLRQAFLPQRYKKYFDPENPTHTYNHDALVNGTIFSAIIGGCVQAYGYAKRDLHTYKQDRGSHIYESRSAVFRARQQTWVQSFMKYGLRWGWRIGFLFSSMFLISQSLTIYKLDDRMSHYVIAAAVPTALYKWKLGLSGMLKTGLVGAILVGVPIGFIFASMGYNARSLYYFSQVEPRVVGPLTEQSMSAEQYFCSHSRMLAILDLLNTEHCDELNNARFYREFLGTDE